MITNEDVVMAYRVLQGREPESAEVIQGWIENAPLQQDLLVGIITSDEFQRRMQGRLTAGHFRVAQDCTPMDIDMTVTPEQLDQLFAKIKDQWEKIGGTEAHWSVLSDERYRSANLAESIAPFYATGAKELSTLRSYLKRNGLELESFTTCFELGCGVGRITSHLVDAFPSVIAADISGGHLQIAHERLAKRANLRLKKLDFIAELDDIRGFDFFYSIIVLQHNPPPVIRWMLVTILRNLADAGVAFFQIPSYYENYQFRVESYLHEGLQSCWNVSDPLHEHWGNPAEEIIYDAHPLPQREVFRICREAGCEVMEVREDDWVGEQRHSISNSYLVRKRVV